jgi:UDP-glucose 4-epimerase
MNEEHPQNPESPYAVSKMTAEKYCFAFYKVYGVPTTSLRYFNVYGPRQESSEYANVIPIFFSRIKQGMPLTIFGDGKQTRDFVFVEDVVTANVLAATHPAAAGEIFNIATGQASSVNQIADIAQQVSAKETSVVYADARAGEVKHSRADVGKAKKLLGYTPQTTLDQGLLLTWQGMTT